MVKRTIKAVRVGHVPDDHCNHQRRSAFIIASNSFSALPQLSLPAQKTIAPQAKMLYIATLLAFAAAVTATPVPAALCPAGLYSNPQCCATDVLGAVGLNCAVRKYSHYFTVACTSLTKSSSLDYPNQR
jgi:hypothetical protein